MDDKRIEELPASGHEVYLHVTSSEQDGYMISEVVEGLRAEDDKDCVSPLLHRNNRALIGYSGVYKVQSLSDTNGAFLRDGNTTEDSEKCCWQKVERCIAASIKGFAIGAGLRGGLAIFTTLRQLRRNSVSRKNGANPRGRKNNEPVLFALKETMRYGLFLGTFAGAFCTVDEAIAAAKGCRRTARWRALFAGAVAGPALLLTGRDKRHTSLAIYILMRAAVLAARCGIKNEKAGWLFRPLKWKHGDTFLMCLSASQIFIVSKPLPVELLDVDFCQKTCDIKRIISVKEDRVPNSTYIQFHLCFNKCRTAWILKPESLPSSYRGFLNKHGGKKQILVKGFSEVVLSIEPRNTLEAIEQHYKENGVNVHLNPYMSIPCKIIHGNQGCVPHFFSFLLKAYFRALPVYAPVYLVPAIIVHRRGLFARPKTILSKTLLGTARSSMFLAVYCASAWAGTCGLFRLAGRCNTPLTALALFPAGLALMIEKKSQRMEIALYCVARAIESFSNCASDWDPLRGYFVSLPSHIDIILFSLATAIIMHCYSQEREIFRSKYLNVLDWVFGLPSGGTLQMHSRNYRYHAVDAKLETDSANATSGHIVRTTAETATHCPAES